MAKTKTPGLIFQLWFKLCLIRALSVSEVPEAFLLARPIPGGDWTLSLCVWLHRHFFSGLPCSTFSTPPASCAPEQPGGTRRAHVAPFSSHGTRRLPYIRHACLEGQITTINQNGSKLVAHLRRRATYTYARKFRIHIHTGELVGYTSHSQVVASFKLESCYLKVLRRFYAF